MLVRFILNVLLYQYEPFKKNKFINSIGGFFLSIFNSILILSLLLSILFASIDIKNNTLQKLKESMIFNYIYTIKIIFIDHEK